MELARERLMNDKMHTDIGVVPTVKVPRLPTPEEKSRVRDEVEAGRRISPRQYDRFEQSSYRRRSKKANARHQKRVRDARMDRDTLIAQIRVASGKTGASPALVANAQKALERRVADVRAENPGMTEERAAELVFSAVIGQ